MKQRTTAKYRIITDSGGSRYQFFCDASGMALCTTEQIRADTQAEELRIAWESEGKHHFNQCTKCGCWVSDPMYNADLLQCVDCAPWQTQSRYCTYCGEEFPATDRFCRACGRARPYREVTT